MPFTNDGPLKLLVTKSGSSYDFVVVRDTTNVSFRGTIQGRFIWSSAQATSAEIRDSSGHNMGASEGSLKSVFILADRPPFNGNGTLRIQEASLRSLKSTNLADYNRIMESFLSNGEVRLGIATTTSQTFVLPVGVQQDTTAQNLATNTGVGTSPTV